MRKREGGARSRPHLYLAKVLVHPMRPLELLWIATGFLEILASRGQRVLGPMACEPWAALVDIERPGYPARLPGAAYRCMRRRGSGWNGARRAMPATPAGAAMPPPDRGISARPALSGR